ncbi:MAG: ATP-binding cassette domain-containing protein, partial [Rhodospirillaceae bacterium]|nr:ATP-binding cassette domain-containing protein [Rhodospirillaceae bacterium]
MRRSGPMAEPPLLEAAGLCLSLPDLSRKPPFGTAPVVDILHGIDLALGPGDTLGIVGESGSGKSRLGRTLIRLPPPTAGR